MWFRIFLFGYWKILKKIKKINKFEIYLFQSLKKNLREHLKRRVRSKEIIQQSIRENPANYEQDSIEHLIIAEESFEFNKKWVKQQIAQLPAKQKEIIFLRFYEGLSYDEIAQVTSKSNQVIRNYVARAIKRIRQFGNLEKLLAFLFLYLLGSSL